MGKFAALLGIIMLIPIALVLVALIIVTMIAGYIGVAVSVLMNVWWIPAIIAGVVIAIILFKQFVIG